MFNLLKRKDPITNKTVFYRKLGIKFQNEWLEPIIAHPLVFAESDYGGSVADRLQKELGILENELKFKYEARDDFVHLLLRILTAINFRVTYSLKAKAELVDVECCGDLVIESGGSITVETKKQNSSSKEMGGIIKLVSSGDITNDGLLRCTDLSAVDVNGTVYICCDGGFINNHDGEIECGKNGRAVIRCSSFEDTGYISSEPSIMINSWKKSLSVRQLQVLQHWSEKLFFVNHGTHVMVCMRRNEEEIRWESGDCIFTVSIDHIDSGTQYTFSDSMNIQIPIITPVFNRNGYFAMPKIRIYAKLKHKSSHFILCKTAKLPDFFAPSKLECDEPLSINDALERVIRKTGNAESFYSFTEYMCVMNKEELIKLTVRKYRGNWKNADGCQPHNLLKEGTGDYYMSEYGPPNEDWIVFEHDEELRFIPTAVIVRNYWDDEGIKRIAIYGGNNIDDLEEWIEIDGIHNEHNYRQIFPIGSSQRWIAYIEQFKYFKLRILENHGHSYQNIFYEFGIMSAHGDKYETEYSVM